MKTDSFIRLIAGAFVVIGVVLTHFVSPWWILLPLFVGLNLLQSSITQFCPPTLLLHKLGWVDEANVIHWGGCKK
jgi:hypothetical protein